MNFGIRNKRKIIPEEKINIDDMLGIKDIKNGIVVTDNYVLILDVLPINFHLKSKNEKKYIIMAYEGLHKVLKTDFDIRTISRKEDSKDHLDYVKRHAETEENENVVMWIEEYVSFVADISYKNAVKKRFLVYIPYAAPPDMKLDEIDFRDADKWLTEKGMQFIECIRKCGNEVVIPSDKDQFTAQILFELMNVKSAEKESIPYNICAVN